MSKRKELYLFNKKQKVGTEIVCTHFIKKQYSQSFCCKDCKNKFWNDKGDRHRDSDYYRNYNMKHPERLERVGIYDRGDGKFGHYDEDGNFWTFEEEAGFYGMCENPILGI